MILGNEIWNDSIFPSKESSYANGALHRVFCDYYVVLINQTFPNLLHFHREFATILVLNCYRHGLSLCHLWTKFLNVSPLRPITLTANRTSDHSQNHQDRNDFH